MFLQLVFLLAREQTMSLALFIILRLIDMQNQKDLINCEKKKYFVLSTLGMTTFVCLKINKIGLQPVSRPVEQILGFFQEFKKLPKKRF